MRGMLGFHLLHSSIPISRLYFHCVINHLFSPMVEYCTSNLFGLIIGGLLTGCFHFYYSSTIHLLSVVHWYVILLRVSSQCSGDENISI